MIAFLIIVQRLVRMLRRGLHDPEFQALGLAVVVTLAIGTTFYCLHEGWSVIDSLYFCVCTLTTIGFGDFAPTTELSRIFTIFYVFVGVGLIASFIALVASYRNELGKLNTTEIDMPDAREASADHGNG